jgi:hypothetical protein
MDPNFKLILDEIQKSKEDFNRRFDEHNTEWTRRFTDFDSTHSVRDAAVDKRFDALESACTDLASDIGKHVDDLERADRVSALEVAATDLGTWRPEVEALVDDLKLEVKKLMQANDRKVFDAQPPWLHVGASPSSTTARTTVGVRIESPSGHGYASYHRDVGSRSVTT